MLRAAGLLRGAGASWFAGTLSRTTLRAARVVVRSSRGFWRAIALNETKTRDARESGSRVLQRDAERIWSVHAIRAAGATAAPRTAAAATRLRGAVLRLRL